MAVDPRAWPAGTCNNVDRQQYVDGDPSAWSASGMVDVGKSGGFYQTRSMAAYPDRNAYYPEHGVADMTSTCGDPYGPGPMVQVAPPHGMYDGMAHQQHYHPNGPSAEMEHWHLQMLSQTDPFLALPMREGAAAKRKRRRVISMEQRKAANIRERRRMYQLNEAFDVLRKRVPTFAYEKKLSRIETLKLAVTYIEFMGEILENNGEKCKELINKVKDKLSAYSDDDSGAGLEDNDLLLDSPKSDQSQGLESSHTGCGDDVDSSEEL